jgi:hypothetical protein
MSEKNDIPQKQRALVLQGGGALGAYEAIVLEVLCKKLSEDDKESNNPENRLLFDIVAGHPFHFSSKAVKDTVKLSSWNHRPFLFFTLPFAR